ncbi:hypothetical protein EON65_51335 [archaeon]|nr:MAG: hypothetical protein EON65_51335 [archaeon]
MMSEKKEDYEVSGVDASLFVWNLLWTPQRGHFHKLHILDTFVLQGGTLKMWLFTTKEGDVKSKGKKRWNNTSLVDRMTGPDGLIKGFYCAKDWKYISDRVMLDGLLTSNSETKMPLVSYSHLTSLETSKHFFLQIVYEFRLNNVSNSSRYKCMLTGDTQLECQKEVLHNGIGVPVVKVYSLCHKDAAGKVAAQQAPYSNLSSPSNTHHKTHITPYPSTHTSPTSRPKLHASISTESNMEAAKEQVNEQVVERCTTYHAP